MTAKIGVYECEREKASCEQRGKVVSELRARKRARRGRARESEERRCRTVGIARPEIDSYNTPARLSAA